MSSELRHVILVGVLARITVWLLASEWLENRVELHSPQAPSISTLQDAAYFIRQGRTPYDGDAQHAHPIILALHALLSQCWRPFLIGLDIVTAVLLAEDDHEKRSRSPAVARLYLWNPLTIMAAAAGASRPILSCLTAALIRAFRRGNTAEAAIFLAILAALAGPHQLVMVVSLAMIAKGAKERTSVVGWTFALYALLALGLPRLVSDRALTATWDFIWKVPDQAPNVGVWWYFFTQVFVHFRPFFLAVFHANVFVYGLPLAVVLADRPFLHLVLAQLLLAVFAPFPTAADSAIYLALLPLFGDQRKLWRYSLLVGVCLSACIILEPVVWQLWVATGAGNANFYFGVTMAHSIAQIYILMDLLYAHFREQTEKLVGKRLDARTHCYVLH